MSGIVMGVAWYRYRATRRRSWSSYLNVAMLIGLIGGVNMSSIAARRSQSSYSTFMASANTSALTMAAFSNASGVAGPDLKSKMAKLSGVKHVGSLFSPSRATARNRCSTFGYLGTGTERISLRQTVFRPTM